MFAEVRTSEPLASGWSADSSGCLIAKKIIIVKQMFVEIWISEALTRRHPRMATDGPLTNA